MITPGASWAEQLGPGDCNYQTLAQCQASASGRWNVYCAENIRFLFARQRAAQEQAVQQPRRRQQTGILKPGPQAFGVCRRFSGRESLSRRTSAPRRSLTAQLRAHPAVSISRPDPCPLGLARIVAGHERRGARTPCKRNDPRCQTTAYPSGQPSARAVVEWLQRWSAQ